MTSLIVPAIAPARISTHTPLARRDPAYCIALSKLLWFLLTRLLRGVTNTANAWFYLFGISAHTPLARRDSPRASPATILSTFLLTRLLRGVTPRHWTMSPFGLFLLTRLLRGVTWSFKCSTSSGYFYSHASCEAWLLHGSYVYRLGNNFYSHASCEAWLSRKYPALPL